jgi:hypothetical protein
MKRFGREDKNESCEEADTERQQDLLSGPRSRMWGGSDVGEDSGACEMERHLLLSWLCSSNVIGARPSHLISAPADRAANGRARR